MSALDRATRVASSAGGQVLRAATGIVAVRPAAKPLHPRGGVLDGDLRRSGAGLTAADRSGVPWLDEAGDDPVLVRQSRSIGLPEGLPDVHGLAIRVPAPGGTYGDLLFATTGLGGLTRFVLTPARTPFERPMTTLLPYRTPAGGVVLCAAFRDDTTLELGWAIRSGPWHPFAELTLRPDPSGDEDPDLSFDPIRNTLPGLETYDWVRRLREPSYRTARRSRGD